MFWDKLVTRFTTKKNPSPAYHALDRKLVKNNQKSFLPGWAQLKYVKHFLNPSEQRIFVGSWIALLVSLVTIGGLFTSSHIERLPTDGGEYSEALIGQPKSINPLFATINDVDADLSALVYAGLFRYNKDSQFVPDVAAGYTVSTDQKTYTISLRPDVHFSDGELLTADDVLFTFETIQNPEVGSPLLSTFQGVKVEKVNDTTVNFTLKEPFSPFINSLTIGILPVHVWGELTPASLKLAKQNIQPIGAGAWQFNKLFKGENGYISSYSLSRNERYFGEKPHITNLRFVFFYTYQEAIDAMRTDNTLALSFLPHSYISKVSSRDFDILSLKLPQYTTLFFNETAQPTLKDDDVRLALSTAVNKEVLVAEALNGYGETIESPILKGSIGYYPEIKKITFDTTKANEMLDKKWSRIQPEDYFKVASEALLKESQEDIDAFKKTNSSTPELIAPYEEQIKQQINNTVRERMDSNQTFYRKDKNNVILEITITTADTPEYSKTAELISTMWQAAGVRTTIQKISSQQIVRELLQKRNYQALLYGEIVGFDPDPFPFWHSSQADYPGVNLAGYANRNADKLLEQGRTTMDPKERENAYKQFQDLLIKDVPAIFLYSPTYSYAMSKKVQGITLTSVNAPADRFLTINEWYVKTKWQWK